LVFLLEGILKERLHKSLSSFKGLTQLIVHCLFLDFFGKRYLIEMKRLNFEFIYIGDLKTSSLG